MKNLLIILLVIGYCALVITAPVVAAGENLLLVTSHAGGSAEAISGALKLWTIYGQPFAGQSPLTSGYIGKWGAIWWGDAGVTGISTGEDNGLINSTVIERVADAPDADVRIRFRSKDASITQASIFRLSGSGTEFSNQVAGWVLVAQNVAITLPGGQTDTVWLESNGINIQPPPTKIKVADGNNAYYRVVPSTVTDPAQIFGSDASGTPYNARTVGKVDALVPGVAAQSSKPYKYTFISHPFIVFGSGSTGLIGAQLASSNAQANATELWGWTGTTFGMQEYLNNANGWVVIGSNQTLDPANGSSFVIKTKEGMTDKTISLVGVLRNDVFGPKIVGANLYSFLGQPQPYSVAIANLGLGNAEGGYEGTDSGFADQLWGWTGDSFGEQMYLKKNTGWTVISGFTPITQLQLTKGYIYRRNPSAPGGGFNWQVNQ